jgi:hypothetical protein
MAENSRRKFCLVFRGFKAAKKRKEKKIVCTKRALSWAFHMTQAQTPNTVRRITSGRIVHISFWDALECLEQDGRYSPVSTRFI